MKKVDKLRDNALNMKQEYLVSNHKICRTIDAIFVDEIKHFHHLFNNFNEVYGCVDSSEIPAILESVKKIFESCKVILVDEYQSKFEKNVDGLVVTMYDFFIRKLSNPCVKQPVRDLDRYLSEICKFECFKFQNKLEDALIDFSEEFVYRYINSDEAKRDFVHLMKNLNYSIVCEMKKAISNSIEDKQEIAMRYNRLNKSVTSKSRDCT